MAGKGVKRRLRYWVQMSAESQDPLPHRWVFLAINTQTELDRIGQKLLEKLAMTDDLIYHYAEPVPRSQGLKCVVFSFLSEVGTLEKKNEVYDSSNFRRDRDLSIPRNSDGWRDYVEGIIK